MRRIALLSLALVALLPAAAAAQDQKLLVKRLTQEMRYAGGYAGAYVVKVSRRTGRGPSSAGVRAPRASWPPTPSSSRPRPRWRASGARARSAPRCSEPASSTPEGVYRGSLYLRGGGDPTFGSRRFTQALVRRRGDRRGPRRPRRGDRDRAGHRPRPRRRVGLRLASRRPRLRLRDLVLGGPAERAVLQPRPVHGGRPADGRGTRRRSPPRGSTTRSRRAACACA